MRVTTFSTILAVGLLLGAAATLPAHAERGHRSPHGSTSSHSASPRGGQVESHSSASQPRTAVPRSGEASRGRTPGTRGYNPHGGSYGHDYGRYDYRGGGYYPGGYDPYGYLWGWGWWGWGWGSFGYYPGYPWGGGPYYYPERVRADLGALDLDVRPEKAQVYLDGHLIGVADDFDGWPRYLWLEKGTYDLVFYYDGFKTIARQYSIYPGVVIDVEDSMVPGQSTRPEDLAATSTERRDERLERREERGEGTTSSEPDWRARMERERGEMEAPPATPSKAERPYDARQKPARLVLSVVPPDAAIYLDGRFLGTGDDILRAQGTITVDPGDHELEVVRPGYASKTTSFSAEAGEEVDLKVELEKE